MIIGVVTVTAMVSDLRKAVNAWAVAEVLGTGIRILYAVFKPPHEKRRYAL